MNPRRLYFILLILFSGYTAYTMSIAQQSLLSFGYQLISSPDTAQVVIDLYIMAFLALVWMYQDTKLRGKAVWYWFALCGPYDNFCVSWAIALFGIEGEG